MSTLDDELSRLDRDALRDALKEALHQAGELADATLPSGVETSTLRLVPREEGLAPKDIPVETLLSKVVMMRDKLRVAEQRINASDALTAAQKFQLQAHITELYRLFSALGPLLSVPADAPEETP
ncbi:MAG: hypothetical protein AB2A00_40970 [Myxococcota bacterium]